MALSIAIAVDHGGRLALLLATILLTAGVASAQLRLERIASGLPGSVVAAAPEDDPRLFIGQRDGRIWILEDGEVSEEPFLDIRNRVSAQGEGGLLGFAFPPGFDSDPEDVFYVYYTAAGSGDDVLESRVVRFGLDADEPRTAADPESEALGYSIGQPLTNHNGGTVAIRDGFLYFGLGDGGGARDPNDAAQDDATDLGKMLRFDLSELLPWTPERWAKGLRNPYRFSFDRDTGDLYIADVGQGRFEEIDVEPAAHPGGRNYGWDVLEGTRCEDPSPGEPLCDDPSLVLPVHQYRHASGDCSEGGGGSVTGGVVYRGEELPEFDGHYWFADFCQDRIWTLQWDGADGIVGDARELSGELIPNAGSSSGIVDVTSDGQGEVVIVSIGGDVFRVVPEPGPAALWLAALLSLVVQRRRGVIR